MTARDRTYNPALVPLARGLRRATTPAEAVVWKHVRGRRFDGLKFRRQQPVGRYVADFCCHEARLILEIDGETHLGKAERDARRQRTLEGEGYLVLRFWNPDVYDDLDTVLDTIWATAAERRGVRLPSPLGGEGLGVRGTAFPQVGDDYG